MFLLLLFLLLFFFFSCENTAMMRSNKASTRYGNQTYSLGRVFRQKGGVHN